MATEFISIQESAELSNKSIQTIRRALKAKKLKYKRSNTPQGFNYLINRESLCLQYGIRIPIEGKAAPSAPKVKKAKKTNEIAEESVEVTAADFRHFTKTLEKMVNQHSDERQNFLRLVNTMQEKVFFLENQINLLKEPAGAKHWFQFWK
jgi:hypothetical protein